MSEKKSMTDRLTPEDTPLSIFPHPPALSSRRAAWDSIYLEHHYQPAYESPEYRYGCHLISIHIGRPNTIEKWTENRRFERKSVLEGDVGIYPASIRYRERCHREIEFIDLYLETTLLTRAAYDLVDADCVEIVPCFAKRDPLIQQIGLALKAELESSGERLYAESMANALATHLLLRYSAPKQAIQELTVGLPKHKLRQAIEYINDHLEHDLSVEAIATIVQMSPYYFSRLFKQSTGVAPHQYIIQCRVERAKQLLVRGELAIAEVAYSVGFASQSHLNRHFKRLLGVTPRAFLRK